MPFADGWTPAEQEVMHVLVGADGAPWATVDLVGPVSERLGRRVSTSTVTVACRKLRERGLIDGEWVDGGKHRRMVWRCTLD